MKQLLQSLRDGSAVVADVPEPSPGPKQVLVHTSASVVSPGTERMLTAFGRAGWVERARAHPDRVRKTLEKARTDGVAAAMEAVNAKLDQPLTPGYCNAGRIAAVGADVTGFVVGDRVVCNGAHAEAVTVPATLCATIPDAVDDQSAALAVMGAIGLQGIRLAGPTLGERVAVIGLGVVGLLTVQLLRAQGCHVLGIDPVPERRALALRLGAQSVAGPDDVQALSDGQGFDAVLIAAAAKDARPVALATQMCRKRGRIILIGVADLKLDRTQFYEKELSFQVSCSYGPGRYDPSYEVDGRDYPISHVRWTAQRNIGAVLDLMARGSVVAEPLISHRFPIEKADEASALLASNEPTLAILLDYPTKPDPDPAQRRRIVFETQPQARPSSGVFGFLGAGQHAGRTLIRNFKAAGAGLHTIVSAGGVNAAHLGRKHGFQAAVTDQAMVFDDAAIDTVVIATRHGQHAGQVLAAMQAGKHVFCEKPLCLDRRSLEAIATAMEQRPAQHLMVGFNRRFAPLTIKTKALLTAVEGPKQFVMTVNAGAVPSDHWTLDPSVGGGRIIGEACHFIDLLRHLAGAPITEHRAFAYKAQGGKAGEGASIMLAFDDGSHGVIHYLTSGHRSFPKERLEVFAGGRVLRIDNFKTLRGWGWPSFAGRRLWRQDKGHRACAEAFLEAVRGGKPPPIDANEIIEVSGVAIDVANSLRK